MLKTLGYTVSTLSVLLLAIPAWKGASENPPLLAALIAGVLTSIGGMFLRWLSFLKDRRIMHDLERFRPAATHASLAASNMGSGDGRAMGLAGGRGAGGAGKRRAGADG